MSIHTQTGSVREPDQPINPPQAEFDRLISRNAISGKTHQDRSRTVIGTVAESIRRPSGGR